MKSCGRIMFYVSCSLLLISCSKSDPIQPNTSKPVISNLVYSPTTVTIRPATATYIIYGTINFDNAVGGVSKIRLTTSAGGDVTVMVNANSETKGTLTGSFEIAMPDSEATYTFDIWIIDGNGNSSNKLSGSVKAVIDDSATNWTKVSQTWPLHRVLWANSKYIAVGVNGVILTSPDGYAWTNQNSGTTATLFGVAWSGSLYLAVGTNKTILTSTDGVSWTTRSSNMTGITLYGVACSGSSYVAVGENTTNSKTEILTSADGINWSSSSYSVLGGTLLSVRWIGNQYVAVGGANGYPLVLTSINGTDWNNRSSSITIPGQLADIAYSGSKYAAVGYGVTASSNDCINWTGNATDWGSAGVTWSGSRFAAASIVGVMTSVDGINWTKAYDSAYPLRSIAWGSCQYVTVGFISPIIMVSP
jgi:hypothetical protein